MCCWSGLLRHRFVLFELGYAAVPGFLWFSHGFSHGEWAEHAVKWGFWQVAGAEVLTGTAFALSGVGQAEISVGCIIFCSFSWAHSSKHCWYKRFESKCPRGCGGCLHSSVPALLTLNSWPQVVGRRKTHFSSLCGSPGRAVLPGGSLSPGSEESQDVSWQKFQPLFLPFCLPLLFPKPEDVWVTPCSALSAAVFSCSCCRGMQRW